MKPSSPSLTRMLSRGITRRCGRCGSRHLFRGWFKMIDRCPRCGYLFDREEGFFLGAFLINFIVTEALLGVVLGILIALEASGGTPLGPIIAAAVGETVLVPLIFYPFSKTVWTAIDMAMHRDQVFADYPGPPAGIT